MATPTPAQQKAIADLYIALFNRAPDADGFAFWTQALADGASLNSIAQSFVTTPEARAVYPESQTAEQFVSAYYSNVLGRPIDANGLAFWTQVLQASGGVGSTAARANLVSQIVEIVNTPLPTKPDGLSDEAYALTFADRNAFKNKGEIAIFYAVEYKGNDLNLAKQVLAVVGPATTTIEAAKALLNPPTGGGGGGTPPVVAPAEFIGTVDEDKFIAGTADTTFKFVVDKVNPANTTLTLGDVITGGAGNDTLTVTATGGIGGPDFEKATISGIENIVITRTDTSAVAYQASTDVKNVTVQGGSGDVTLSTLTAGAKAIIKDTTGGPVFVAYSGAVGPDITLSSMTGAALTGISGSGTSLTMTLTSAGSGNSVNSVEVNDKISVVKIVADAAFSTGWVSNGSNLKVEATGAATVNLGVLSATLTEVDASANTGGLTAVLDASNTSVKVTGSAGNDTISTGIALVNGSVNAGAGTGDRLIVTNTAALADDLGLKYTGFDIVRVANGVLADLTKIAGITAVEIDDGGSSTGVALGNATQAGNVTILSANPAGAIAFGSVGGFDTLKASVVTKAASGAQNIDLTGLTLHSSLTKLELTGNDAVGDATGLVTLTTSNARTLTSIVVNNAGGAAITVNSGHTGTNLSIDASASAGAVTINASAYGTTIGATLKGGSGGGLLIGSRSADTIIGGAGDDYILGDGSFVNFATKEVQTVGFSGQTVNAGTYTLGNYVVNVVAGRSASDIAEAIVGTEKAAFLLANPTVENITYNGGGQELTITFKASAGDVAPITSIVGGAANFFTGPGVETTKGWGGLAAATAASADTLTGGGGKNTFVFAQNSSTVTDFDTITDLNLGTDAAGGRVDTLSFHNPNGVASIVTLSDGQQAAVTSAGGLAAAVSFVLGVASTDGATALFTYGADTYILHNGDGNATFDNAADFLVMVTGVTGTLDLSDVVLM